MNLMECKPWCNQPLPSQAASPRFEIGEVHGLLRDDHLAHGDPYMKMVLVTHPNDSETVCNAFRFASTSLVYETMQRASEGMIIN